MKKITLKPFSLKAYRMVLPNAQKKNDKESTKSIEPSKRSNSQKFNKTHLTIPKIKTYKRLKSLKNELIKQTLNNFNLKPNLNLSLTITNDISRPPPVPKKRGNYIYHNYRNKHIKANNNIKNGQKSKNNYLTESFDNHQDKQSILNYFSMYDNSNSLYSILAKERNKFKIKLKNLHNKTETKPILIKSKTRPNTPNNKKIFNTVFKETIYDDIIPLNDCHYRTITENERYIKYMEDLRFIQHLVLESTSKEQAENYVLCFLNENRIFEPNQLVPDKINNFITFLQKDISYEPTIQFKQYLLNILNDKEHIKPNNEVVYRNFSHKKLGRKNNEKRNISNDVFLQNYLYKPKYLGEIDIINNPLHSCITLQKEFDHLSPQIKNKLTKNEEDEIYLSKKDIVDIKKKKKLLEVVCYQRARERINLLTMHNQMVK